MKMPNTFSGSSPTKTDSRALTRELILRQQFLVLALDRADEIVESVSHQGTFALVTDLNECIDYFRSISDGLGLPAFAHIAKKEVGDWEKEMFVAFSAETPRCDRVLRMNHELDQILFLFEKVAEARPGFQDEIEEWHFVFQSHKNLQASVLRNWIVAEQTHGHPIERVIAAAESDWRRDWERVIVSLGFAQKREADLPSHRNSLYSVVERFLHPFSHKNVDRVA